MRYDETPCKCNPGAGMWDGRLPDWHWLLRRGFWPLRISCGRGLGMCTLTALTRVYIYLEREHPCRPWESERKPERAWWPLQQTAIRNQSSLTARAPGTDLLYSRVGCLAVTQASASRLHL